MRGTSRTDEGLAAIGRVGIEAGRADPDRLGTVIDLIGDVTVIAWLMGSAGGEVEAAVVNGPRLESLLERLVDTPVRGFILEARGSAPAHVLEAATTMVEAAAERWHIPVRILRADPADPPHWVGAAKEAVTGLVR